MDFTKQQDQAINAEPAGNILVSASAGSGKTRVLVERVIRKIKAGVDIDKLLIVTFTKAAAKEMQERIRKALQAAINATDDAHLQHFLLRQIRKLPVADISTMDAFCQRLVQRYYYVINLDPEFRILTDRTEVQLLRDQVWENLREDLYTQDADDPEHHFAKLVDNFANDRSDDNLTDLIYDLYDFANVNQNPQAWLTSLPYQYQINDNLTTSPLYQKMMVPILNQGLEQMLLQYRSALEYAQNTDADLTKETAFFATAVETIQTFQKKLPNASWNQLKVQFDKNPTKNFPKGRGDAHQAIKKFNDAALDIWKKQLDARYFQFDEATNLKIIQASKTLVETLVTVLKQFDQRYRELKRQRHGMEFIDIEHAAYDILHNASRSKMVRQNLQQQYQEIMVDEYQDNNRLQDAILNQIARKDDHGAANNLFMVGDVKQSIYRFRLSDPNLFLHRQKFYQKADNDNVNINLADNFRSARNLDCFVNLVFKQLMDRQVGRIDYQGPAELKFGAKYYPDDVAANVEMLLYDDGANADVKPDLNEQFQVSDADHGQLELVANKIEHLVHDQTPIFDHDQGKMRAVKYSDIAILSATRHQNLILADVFDQHNIPVTISGNESYFKTTELQIMMSLLKIIDNPYQDIPLVAVLRSPIVGLNENQLAYIRINQNTGDYYHAVTNFVRGYDSSKDERGYGEIIHRKLERFLKQLEAFRDYARHHELVDLIWHIYQETGFLDYVGGMPAGKQRQVNLHALYQRAADYEKTSFKGLFQFVRFIERMQEHDQDLAEPIEVANDDNVKVMTIHGSKGLEFPIVFLIDLQHQFNVQETKRSYVLNDRLGIGIDYLDPQYREKMPTLPKQLGLEQIKSDNRAEEMRKLYVALTRAEQQLYLVGIVKGKTGANPQTGQDVALQNWQKAHFSLELTLDAALRIAQNSALDWLGLTLERHPHFKQQFDLPISNSVLAKDATRFTVRFVTANDLTLAEAKPSTGNNKASESWLTHLNDQPLNPARVVNADDIRQLMNFVYPHQAATHTTAYQAVSEIKRLFDDPDVSDMGQLIGDQAQHLKQSNRYVTTNFATPQFLQTVTRPSAAEVGTATHLILQKIDVTQKPTLSTVEHLIQRLVKQGIVTTQVAQLIDRKAIVKFFDSTVGKLILQHPDRLHREVPFSLLMAANELFTDFSRNADEQVLIHGIIDGYLTLDDQVILFDYKTDHLGGPQLKAQIKRVTDKYRGQLNLYALALQKILRRPVNQRYLYLLALNRLEMVTN